jgi:hypothetical protein
MSSQYPRPHGEWLQEDYDSASAQPGTAEYLSTLLTGPDHSCPHSEKTKTKGMPNRMGFFRKTDGTHTYLDTAKVCQPCYDLAVPEGFNVWSTAYKPGTLSLTQENKERLKRGEIKGPLNMRSEQDYYPAMFQAGTEEEPDVIPITGRPLPMNAEPRELWRYMQDQEKPFYVDQLHLEHPWDPNAPEPEVEDQRVARENYPAYENAALGFVGTGVGGAGVNSIVEQRILGERARELPARFGRSPYLAGPDDPPFTGAQHSPERV